MTIELKVRLDKSKTPWVVDVDETNNGNHVPRSPDQQTIKWLLHGNAESERIVAFEWLVGPSRSDIFTPPAYDPAGSYMIIRDTNDRQETVGIFTYRLGVAAGSGPNNVYYTTATISTRAVSNNPSIRNN
jgi:hypothetical protein